MAGVPSDSGSRYAVAAERVAPGNFSDEIYLWFLMLDPFVFQNDSPVLIQLQAQHLLQWNTL